MITEDEANRRTINFNLGANAFVMEDENLSDLSALGLPSLRQSEMTDIVLISAVTAFGVGLELQLLQDELVLTPEEQGD